MEMFLGQTLDLANYVLVMILCECLDEILKIWITLHLVCFCFTFIVHTILGIIAFFLPLKKTGY